METVVSVETMRRSDAATIAGGVAGRTLMYRAGEGIFFRVSVARARRGRLRQRKQRR